MGESTFEGAEWFGHDLGGHLLGLVGYGQVGRRVALRALAMGMAVASFDPFVDAGAMRGRRRAARRASASCWPRRASSRCTPGSPPSDADLFGRAGVRPHAGRVVLRQHRARDAGRRGGAVRGAVLGPPRRRRARRRCARVPAGRGQPAARPAQRRGDPAHRRGDVRDARPRRDDGRRGDRALRGRRAARERDQSRGAGRDERAGHARDRRGHRQLPRRRCSTSAARSSASVSASGRTPRCPACPARRCSTPRAAGA